MAQALSLLTCGFRGLPPRLLLRPLALGKKERVNRNRRGEKERKQPHDHHHHYDQQNFAQMGLLHVGFYLNPSSLSWAFFNVQKAEIKKALFLMKVIYNKASALVRFLGREEAICCFPYLGTTHDGRLHVKPQ